MILETKRLYLRSLELHDADGAYPSWLNNPEVTKYNSHGSKLYTKEMALAYIHDVNVQANIQVFAIILKENNQHIGNIALQNIDPLTQCAEFAILIGEHSIYAQGIGEEASKLLIKYAFNDLALKKLYCGTSEHNIGMQRLAQKLNFTLVDIQKNGMQKNSIMVDIIKYELNKEET